MTIQLQHEFSFWAAVDPPVDFGAGPTGQRIFLKVTDGAAEGDRFTARVTGGGGDWLLIGADGFGRIDVRMNFATDDGASVYLRYSGLLELNPAVLQALGTGAATAFEDQYFRTTLQAETGDPRYAWLNQSLFVARGRLRAGGGVEYEVGRLV